MDQGGNGGRALHRIRQPDVKGELGRFRHRSHEHQQAQQDRRRVGNTASGHGLLQPAANFLKAEAAGGPEQTQDSQQQTEVANSVHHKGFLRCIGGAIAVVPKAHEQVGAHAHQLPEHINLQQVGADYQAQHRAAE